MKANKTGYSKNSTLNNLYKFINYIITETDDNYVDYKKLFFIKCTRTEALGEIKPLTFEFKVDNNFTYKFLAAENVILLKNVFDENNKFVTTLIKKHPDFIINNDVIKNLNSIKRTKLKNNIKTKENNVPVVETPKIEEVDTSNKIIADTPIPQQLKIDFDKNKLYDILMAMQNTAEEYLKISKELIETLKK